MNKLLRRVLQSMAVALPLLLGPLRAQESVPEAGKEPATETAPAAAPAPAAENPAATDADDSVSAEENVSADNSLSFPVDI